MSNNSPWGYHLILDVAGCHHSFITKPARLHDWIKDLVEEIGMVAYGEPQIVHFGHGEEHLTGYTVVQLIETSNIIAHFNDNSDTGYIDIFSCKEFDQNVAIENVRHWFNPTSINKTFLIRQA